MYPTQLSLLWKFRKYLPFKTKENFYNYYVKSVIESCSPLGVSSPLITRESATSLIEHGNNPHGRLPGSSLFWFLHSTMAIIHTDIQLNLRQNSVRAQYHLPVACCSRCLTQVLPDPGKLARAVRCPEEVI